MSKRISPGAVWRIKYDEAPAKRGGMFGKALHLCSVDYDVRDGTGVKRPKTRTILDEFVLSPFLHVEQMDAATWFVELCDQKCMVRIKGGKATKGPWYT